MTKIRNIQRLRLIIQLFGGRQVLFCEKAFPKVQLVLYRYQPLPSGRSTITPSGRMGGTAVF